MLALTHLIAGAAVGTATGRRGAAVAGGLAAHLVLDGIGHDDAAVGPVAQGVIGLAGLAALASAWGPASPTMVGALAGAAPDSEVALWILLGRDPAFPLIFPSHWRRRDRVAEHPYRFPGTRVHIVIEGLISVATCAALVAAGRRRRQRRR